MLIHVDCWMLYIQLSSHILRTNSSDQCCMFYCAISPIWEARLLAWFGLGAEAGPRSVQYSEWLAIKIYQDWCTQNQQANLNACSPKILKVTQSIIPRFSVAFTVRHRNWLFDTLSCTDLQDFHFSSPECLTK